MKYKTIKDFKFRGKRVLLRVDLNSEIVNGKPELSDRIIEHADTIKKLKKMGAKVIVLAHQGRPGDRDFTSLKEHAKLLNKYTKIKFLNETIGEKVKKEIDKLRAGEAILLENVRFLKEEFNLKMNNKLVKFFDGIVDIYVNDAFSISHREQASIVLFPRLMKSCIGTVMQREIESLDKIKSKDCLYILGGSKIEEIMPLIKNENILSTGVFSLLCLIAEGYNLGKENEILKKRGKEIELLGKNGKHIINPIDLAINIKGKRKDLFINSFPQNYKVLDIGKKTIEIYSEEINKAKVVFMKGSVGYTEDKNFDLGTREILKAISKSKAFSVVSGGHTTTALKRFKINKKSIGYVSLSGGALLTYMAGKELPGLTAIQRGMK